MDSFAGVIDAFGGPAEFAQAIGIADSHARTMKTRDSIPASWWVCVVAAAHRRGLSDITLNLLAALAAVSAQKEVESYGDD